MPYVFVIYKKVTYLALKTVADVGKEPVIVFYLLHHRPLTADVVDDAHIGASASMIEYSAQTLEIRSIRPGCQTS